MRSLCTALALAVGLLAFSSSAAAQPGGYGQPGGQGYPPPAQPYPAPQPTQQPPSQPYPAPQPAPQPGYTPYGVAPNYHLLTPRERDLLMRGEITSGQTIGGGVLAFMMGFGTGHMIQGRWSDTGWMFTLGEGAALTAMFVGLGNCVSDIDGNCESGESLIVLGAVGFGVLRVWEIVDAFTGPGEHNREVRAARWKAYGGQPQLPRYSLFVSPTQGGGNGGVAGLALRF